MAYSSNLKTSAAGQKLIKHWEELRLIAYPDPATKNDPIKKGSPWTIGYGHTGPEVIPGLKWTLEQAESAFIKDLERFEDAVNKYAGNLMLAQFEFDALVSLAFNIGVGAFISSTLVKKLNVAGDKAFVSFDVDASAEQFPKWRNANGQVLLGLRRRRYAEQLLFKGVDVDEAIRRGTLLV